MRTPRPFAQDYMTLIARAHADRAGEPAPPAVRTHFITFYKPRVGVKVQAWFRRQTPSNTPELRVGVSFDAHDRAINARAAEVFAARFAAELEELGSQWWESETNLDRRHMTPLPCPRDTDLAATAIRAVQLAEKYIVLLRKSEVRGQRSGGRGQGAEVRGQRSEARGQRSGTSVE